MSLAAFNLFLGVMSAIALIVLAFSVQHRGEWLYPIK